jgi:hypothetical protein
MGTAASPALSPAEGAGPASEASELVPTTRPAPRVGWYQPAVRFSKVCQQEVSRDKEPTEPALQTGIRTSSNPANPQDAHQTPLLPTRFAPGFDQTPRIETPLPSTTPPRKSMNKGRNRQSIPPVTTQIRTNPVYAVLPRALCVKGLPSSQKKRAAVKGCPSRNSVLGTRYYLPAAAPAAAGIIPAIAIPSIRASTFSTLAPVSVQAST